MGYDFTFGGMRLTALPSGGLFWPERQMLVVADLHLGKSSRMARRGGTLIPPYETRETLEKLNRDLTHTEATAVMTLGDSFDDTAAAEDLDHEDKTKLQSLMAGRDWTWISGNHDPATPGTFGTGMAEVTLAGLHFRHIGGGAGPEISGHLHPKARLAGRSHPCFVLGEHRLILPAYGAFTGGLWINDSAISGLFVGQATALLTGTHIRVIPLPRP